jgi:hypothetical protein
MIRNLARTVNDGSSCPHGISPQRPETPSVWRALVSFALVIPLLITLGAIGTCIASLWMALKGGTVAKLSDSAYG